MLKDIKQITELYLHSTGKLPEDMTWNDFHENLVQTASKDAIGLLADADPKDKCKYALFVNVDTETKTCKVKDYVEINTITNWSDHLFWQGSGGAQSDNIRNTPHKIYSKKGDFSVDDLITPLQTILDDYCKIQEGKGKNKRYKETGPLFWDLYKTGERKWLKDIVDILNNGKEDLTKEIKGSGKSDTKTLGKFPSLKQGESVFVCLTVDGKPIGEYELFRRYLLFVRMRAGIQKGADKFKHNIVTEVINELKGVCPSCHREKPLLDQWTAPAELSFYQMTNESFSSYSNPSASFRLCQSCADLLFVFKQHLLKNLSRELGGNECLVLPSIKLLPTDQYEKRRLFANLEKVWDSSSLNIQPTEERLLYRLAQLPSYATISFIFGDYVTAGKSQNVRRMDEINIVFPDVLPSRLSQIASAIQNANSQLAAMWSLTKRTWQCSWNIQDDFYLLYRLFYPVWEEKKKNKSRRRPEIERYLRAMFYGENITLDEISNDCHSNLVSAIRTTRTVKKDDNNRYARDNYIGNLLSLMVFLEKLKIISETSKEDLNMTEMLFELKAMPELGKFIEMHPLFKDRQYLAPFFVGCLFAYAESLQKENSRLAAYNWLGTMALTYDDILNDIYHKVLNYITNKEKIVSNPRLQELIKAIAYYDIGGCDNDRVALTAFCHGWAVGRDFIYKKKEKTEETNQEGGKNNE